MAQARCKICNRRLIEDWRKPMGHNAVVLRCMNPHPQEGRKLFAEMFGAVAMRQLQGREYELLARFRGIG